MIYTIGGIKGGCGKTTIATNFTILMAAEGRDVLLVDADDQETATDFTAWRNQTTQGNTGYTAIQLTGDAVRTETLKLVSKYDDIVIDAGGRDTTSQRAALTVTDIYLVPFIPRSFDMWTLEKVVRLVEEIRPVNPRLKAFTFLNRADPRGVDNQEAADYLADNDTLTFLNAPLGDRKAFSNAAAQGLAVTELKPTNQKAVEEISTLFQHCYNVSTNTNNNVIKAR